MERKEEKDVVLDKKINVEKFIRERLKENEDLFTKEEQKYISENKECVKKIYLLGFINAKNCYKK